MAIQEKKAEEETLEPRSSFDCEKLQFSHNLNPRKSSYFPAGSISIPM